MRNKAEEWEIIRNEEFYTLIFKKTVGRRDKIHRKQKSWEAMVI